MRLNKKSIVIAVSVAVLLVGSIAGVVLAAGNDNSNQSNAQGEDLLAKVCTIYQQNTGVAIDETALKNAFTQAENEAQLAREQARLNDLVTQGKITQDQADQYLKWWQSKPNISPGFGFRGFDRFHGMGGMRGPGFPCRPPAQ